MSREIAKACLQSTWLFENLNQEDVSRDVRAHALSCHRPAWRAIARLDRATQYAATRVMKRNSAGYWIPALRAQERTWRG